MLLTHGHADHVGDTVSIQESRPHSKLKTWELVSSGAGEGSSLMDKVKSLVGLSGKG